MKSRISVDKEECCILACFARTKWLTDWLVDEMIEWVVEEMFVRAIVKTEKWWWEGDGGSNVWYVLQMWEHDEWSLQPIIRLLLTVVPSHLRTG